MVALSRAENEPENRTWYHRAQVGADFSELTPGPDGGIHFGTQSQASMRGSGIEFAVKLDIRRPKRLKDTGGDWRAKIRAAKKSGHDSIIYLNRYEGIDIPRHLALLDQGWTAEKFDSLSDAAFKKLFPGSEDSVIVFDKRQIRAVATSSPASSIGQSSNG